MFDPKDQALLPHLGFDTDLIPESFRIFGEIPKIIKLIGIHGLKGHSAVTRGSPAMVQRERWDVWDGTEGRGGRWVNSGLTQSEPNLQPGPCFPQKGTCGKQKALTWRRKG